MSGAILQLAAVALLGVGCGGGLRPPPRSSRASRPRPPLVDSREPSCPGGLPARRPADLTIELERDGERWLIVSEPTACSPDLMDTMTPPLGWDYAPRRCAPVSPATHDRLYRALTQAHVDQIRIRRPDPLPSGRAFALTWGSTSCRVGAVRRPSQLHPDDREAFGAAVSAVEAVLPPEDVRAPDASTRRPQLEDP